jgi:hypothetical protein
MQQPGRNSKMTIAGLNFKRSKGLATLEVVISITIWVVVVASISRQLIKLVI